MVLKRVRIELPVDSLLVSKVSSSRDAVGLDLLSQGPVVLLELGLLHHQTLLPTLVELQDGVRHEVGGALLTTLAQAWMWIKKNN